MKLRTILFAVSLSYLPLFSASALALTMMPYYSYSEYYGLGGYVGIEPNTSNPVPTGHLSSEHDSEESAGTTSVAGGQAWWSSGGGSVSLHPTSSQGWGEVTSNPEAGTISSRSGANHTDTGTPVSWLVDLGSIQFDYQPLTWGEGSSFGYIRMLWEVGTDGTLDLGDTVNLFGDLNVGGEFIGEDDMSMRTTIMINQMSNAYWLDDREYTDYSILEDFILNDADAMSQMLWFEDESRHSDTSDLVNIDLSSGMTANVGDVILVEAMLSTTATLPNDGIGRQIWADFASTLHTSLTTDTTGAMLTPYGGGGGGVQVPEPATLTLLGLGLAGLGLARRKQRS